MKTVLNTQDHLGGKVQVKQFDAMFDGRHSAIETYYLVTWADISILYRKHDYTKDFSPLRRLDNAIFDQIIEIVGE